MVELGAPTGPLLMGSPQQEALLASGFCFRTASVEPRVPDPIIAEWPCL
jgi:hypothetical protein